MVAVDGPFYPHGGLVASEALRVGTVDDSYSPPSPRDPDHALRQTIRCALYVSASCRGNGRAGGHSTVWIVPPCPASSVPEARERLDAPARCSRDHHHEHHRISVSVQLFRNDLYAGSGSRSTRSRISSGKWLPWMAGMFPQRERCGNQHSVR